MATREACPRLALIALGAVLCGRVPPAVAQSNACAVDVHYADPFADRNRPYFDVPRRVAAGEKICEQPCCFGSPEGGETPKPVCFFALQLCLNHVEEGCSPAAFSAKTIRATGHCGGVRNLQVSPAGTTSTCGEIALVKVRTSLSSHPPVTGKCKIHVSARPDEPGAHRDVERFALICKPPFSQCPDTTTTTTIPASGTREYLLLPCDADACPGDEFLPKGIQVFWPFNHAWYISGCNVFMQTERVDLRSAYAIRQNVAAVAQEIAILAPIAAAVWLVRVKALARLPSEMPGGYHPPK